MTGPVFLTGDVHQMSLSDPDHEYLSGTEVDCALRCAEIAEEYGVKYTLFFTGQALYENTATVRELAEMPNVEIGGHTWDAFMPKILHYSFRVLFDSFYGPERYQRWDIDKTIDAVNDVAGHSCLSWRGHAYRGGETSNEILSNREVKVVSNEVGRDRRAWSRDTIFSLPINTKPDHDHIYHGHKTRNNISRKNRIREDGLTGFLELSRPYPRSEYRRLMLELAKRALGIETSNSDYENKLMSVEDWKRELLADIESAMSRIGYATILAHPACMQIVDNFSTFEEICSYLSDMNTEFVMDAPELIQPTPSDMSSRS